MKYLFGVLCIVFIGGCTPIYYSQLYEAKSTFRSDGGLVFENDTVKISYYFWDENGVLAFSIYNKLNVPLYVDWKKSSFVKRDDKFDYWIDEQTGENTTEYASVRYRGIVPGWSGSTGTALTNTKTFKPERITFIAPHSKYNKYSFSIYNPKGTLLDTSIEMENVQSIWRKNYKTGMYIADFESDRTPLTFRNFLTLSTSEKFEKEFYVDNMFYIASIKEMTTDEFLGEAYFSSDNTLVSPYPYKAENCFYVKNIDQQTTLYQRRNKRK